LNGLVKHLGSASESEEEIQNIRKEFLARLAEGCWDSKLNEIGAAPIIALVSANEVDEIQLATSATCDFCNLRLLDGETGLVYKEVSFRDASQPGRITGPGFILGASSGRVHGSCVGCLRGIWQLGNTCSAYRHILAIQPAAEKSL
jgi:hypothetical protein